MKVPLILLICAFVTGVAAKTKTGAGAPETAPPAPSLDEVSDSEGKISKTKVLGIGEKEILIKDPVTGDEKKIPTDNLIFVRLANGKYYFFFPSEPPPQQAPAKTTAAGPAKWEITAGFAGHFANNDSVADYTGDYAASLVTRYNQQIGSGYSASPSAGAAAIHWQLFSELRLNFESFILGFSAGYAALPKNTALVSAPAQSVQSAISVNGQFFPATFMFYYRFIADGPLGVNFGVGAGALYSALRVTTIGGPADNDQILTSLNPMLVAKPEVTYQWGRITLLLSIPFYWAEARDVTDGEEALLKIKGRNIVAPNLSGVGVMLAAGFRL